MMACGSTPYKRAICQIHSPGWTTWTVPPSTGVAAVVSPAGGDSPAVGARRGDLQHHAGNELAGGGEFVQIDDGLRIHAEIPCDLEDPIARLHCVFENASVRS